MEKQELVILKGLPASGKSTFARAWVDEVPKERIRINRDDIRRSLGPYWIPTREDLVTHIENNTLIGALDEGYSVVSDNTNFKTDINQEWVDKYNEISGNKVIFRIQDFTGTTPQECIKRDGNRPKTEVIGTKVILGMTDKYLADRYEISSAERKQLTSNLKYDPRLTGQVHYDDSLEFCYIFDLDGTLSLMDGRSAYDGESCASDKPNHPVIDTLTDLSHENKIILMSGRNGESQKQTESWLANNFVHYDELYMRKPKDQRKDSVIKEEMYNEYIKDKYNVQGVFDDRNSIIDMWRNLGLPAYQVYYGDF